MAEAPSVRAPERDVRRMPGDPVRFVGVHGAAGVVYIEDVGEGDERSRSEV